MFSFLRKKSLVKRASLAGAVLVLLTGLLFVSCADPGGGITLDDAQAPTISVQPQGGTWNATSKGTFDLTVTASVTDGGTLTYQWYSNTSAANSDGTAISSSGTSATLSLAKADYATNGSYYFYVVVTNTNNSVTGTKTAAKTSNAATVTVTGNTFVLDPNYVGFWSASNGGYDGFVFSASPPSVYNTFNTSDIDDEESIFYKGNIHDIVYFNNNTEGIIYVEFTQRGEYFSSSGDGNFTAIYLKIFSQTSMGIYLIASPGGGYDTPMYANLEAVKTAVNSSNVLTFIYGSVTDGLSYIKQ